MLSLYLSRFRIEIYFILCAKYTSFKVYTVYQFLYICNALVLLYLELRVVSLTKFDDVLEKLLGNLIKETDFDAVDYKLPMGLL